MRPQSAQTHGGTVFGFTLHGFRLPTNLLLSFAIGKNR